MEIQVMMPGGQNGNPGHHESHDDPAALVVRLRSKQIAVWQEWISIVTLNRTPLLRRAYGERGHLTPTLAFLALFISSSTFVFAQQDRISSRIDERPTVIVHGSVHANAQPQYDDGPVDPSLELDPVTLLFKPSPSQQTDLDRFLGEQQDPGSPNYHKWLTPEEYADRFGISQNDIARIAVWLRSKGLSVQTTARGRGWMTFSGTAEQISSAFQTELRYYKVAGRRHVANAVEPSIPAAFEGLVSGFIGLNDFSLNASKTPEEIAYSAQSLHLTPLANFANRHFLAPDDLATIYNISPLYKAGIDGSGQKIVIVGQSGIDPSDIAIFRRQFNLPPSDPQLLLVGPDPGIIQADSIEAETDIQAVGAIARGAKLVYVYAKRFYTAAMYAIDQNVAPVISSSFFIGNCEKNAVDVRSVAQQANAQGITWINAAGDSGAAQCDQYKANPQAMNGLAVLYPASLPEVTGVGGTQFIDANASYWRNANDVNGASALSYIPETAWNQTNGASGGPSGLFATGGGASVLFSKPLWQTGPGVPDDGARDVPDVALAASSREGYMFVIGGALTRGFAGTSSSGPTFAGIVSLLNHYVLSNGFQQQVGLGNINPNLYRLARSTMDVFHDITTGSNIVPCVLGTPDCTTGSYGYTAGPGYDRVTGLGSVDANNLIHEWNSTTAFTTTSLTADYDNIVANGTIQLTVSVYSVSSNITPTGTVVFNIGEYGLGSALLSGSGGTANATVNINVSQIPSSVAITGLYGGDANLSGSSATLKINVPPNVPHGGPVLASITPNPVPKLPADANGYTWYVTVKLNELAGIGATLTSFTVDGFSDPIVAFFGTATIAPYGSVATRVGFPANGVATTRIFKFVGVDASGASWSQQISVVFSGPNPIPALRPNNPVQDAISSRTQIVPGSWVSVYGTDFSDVTKDWSDQDFSKGTLPTSVAGVRVLMNGSPAAVWFVNPTQVNFQAPSNISGTATVQVVRNGAASNITTVQVVSSSPGVNTYTADAVTYYALAQFAGTTTLVGDPAVFGSSVRKATPGDQLVLYATGLTSSASGIVISTPIPFLSPVTVTIGTTTVTASTALQLGAGYYGVVFTVPAELATGNYPFTISANGGTSQGGVSLVVGP
jgi:uncharacterized protein (TIGR03437 family)